MSLGELWNHELLSRRVERQLQISNFSELILRTVAHPELAVLQLQNYE